MAFSVAPLLKRQSQLPAHGHGWITGKNGKRWHPCHGQQQLLNELTTRPQNVIERIKVFIGGFCE